MITIVHLKTRRVVYNIRHNYGPLNHAFYYDNVELIDWDNVICSDEECSSHKFKIPVPFMQWGFYYRFYIIKDDDNKLKVKRGKCSECGKTHGFVPEELIPYQRLDKLLVTIILFFMRQDLKENDAFLTILAEYEIYEDVMQKLQRVYKNVWEQRLLANGITWRSQNLNEVCTSHYKMIFMQIKRSIPVGFHSPTNL